MKHLDEIIFDAIQADTDLMVIIGDEKLVASTCFEVPPDDDDNTPLPNIVITDDGFQNAEGSKDYVWESPEDEVSATVWVNAHTPGEVKTLVRMVRRAVENYIVGMHESGETIPTLKSVNSNGIAWDSDKPCYFQMINYQVITKSDTEDGQEDNT